MTLEVPVVFAFTDGKRGGNPAGVVVNADDYSRDDMQQIAAAVGLSETAFVTRSPLADFKLQFFTPTQQIAHCGHATIATFSYLQQTGRLKKTETSKETIDGLRDIRMEGDQAYMEQLAPTYSALSPQIFADALDALGITESDLLDQAAPCVVNTGNSFLVLGLKDADLVKRLEVDQARIERISETLDLIGFYVFSMSSQLAGRDAGARMFAPRYGIEEESATGMAAGPLACYLYDKLAVRHREFYIEQGHWMPDASPSLINVRLTLSDDGRIKSLYAGGRAEVGETKRIDLQLLGKN